VGTLVIDCVGIIFAGLNLLNRIWQRSFTLHRSSLYPELDEVYCRDSTDRQRRRS
jgi:hypothetical protein